MSSKAVYFNSGKSLLSCDQMICRSNQGLVLSSGVSCKHRSLLLEVGHTGLANRGLSREIGQSPSRGIFSDCQHLHIAKCDA